LYRGPAEDGIEKRVKVHYCKSKHTTERVCQYFLNEPVLGFDLEWVAEANRFQGPRRNVSLIQIASPSRIALFHVALFPKKDDLVAPTFRKIMEDAEVTKVGVAIKADCTRLRKFLDVNARGIFELSHLYKLVKYSTSGQLKLVNKRLVTLATQVREHLHLPLFKGQDVRSSDWTQPLKMDQLICKLFS
jgi:ribonuclease D